LIDLFRVMTTLKYYKDKIITLEDKLKDLKKKSTRYSLLRLCFFLSFIVFLIIFYYSTYYFLPLFISLCSLYFFILYVTKYNKLEYGIKLLLSKIQVNKDEILYLEYQFNQKDTGEEFSSINSFLSNDFDLFGKGSLFQYINRCNTKNGKLKLARNLCSPIQKSTEIYDKQIAINELCNKNDFVQNIQSLNRLITENGQELDVIQNWLNQQQKDVSKIRNLAIGLGLVNVGLTILSSVGIIFWGTVLLTTFVSLSIVKINSRKIRKSYLQLKDVASDLGYYIDAFRIIESESFDSAYLSSIQKTLITDDEPVSNSLRYFCNILSLFEFRDNRLFSLLLNSFFLFDLHVFYYLTRWKLKNKNRVASWFSSFSEVEMLISFATFAFNNQDLVYPKISTNEFHIKAEGIGHPLINPIVRVKNDFVISGLPSAMIITGANMAGKSTFLRTVAVNLLLAMNGSPVVAKEFTFTPCYLFSCIRIQDSLINNESYFYAELLRLKEIIEHVKNNPNTLVILDEILRGTNTKDKQIGTLGLLEKLIQLKASVIIATHDLTIGELEKEQSQIVKNQCFEVELIKDNLFFDYKLKNGISQKLNASFLLKKMGIID